MVKFKVDGMTCGHCVKTVTNVLAKLPKVESVREVNLQRGEVVLDGSPDMQAVVAALQTEGFTARLFD